MKTQQTIRLAAAGLMMTGLVAAVPAGARAAGLKAAPAISSRNSILLQSSFSANQAGPWPLNQHTSVSGGRYNVSVTSNHYSQYHPTKQGRLGDGAIAAIVRLSGAGRGGVMGRFHATSTDAWSMYACWISNNGTFGCLKDVNDNRTAIVKTQHSAAIKPNADNTVILSVVGSALLFRVNGKDVVKYMEHAGSALPAGNWGVYGDNNTTKPFAAHYSAIALIKAS